MSKELKAEADLTEEVVKRMSDLLRNRITIMFERDILKEELMKVTAQLNEAKAQIAALRKKVKATAQRR